MGNYWSSDYWGKPYWNRDYWPKSPAIVAEPIILPKPPAILKHNVDLVIDLLAKSKYVFINKYTDPIIEFNSNYGFIPGTDTDYLLMMDEDLWLVNQ